MRLRLVDSVSPRWRSRSVVLGLCCVLASLVALGTGCERDKPAQPPQESEKEQKPTLRLFAVAGAAGAIEPCGCVKDMLGGIDHAAAFISAQKKAVPHSLVVGAGPMFFEDPRVEEFERQQALFKAEAMASSLGDLGLVAWAPGANDWALGVETFSSLVKESKAHALAANLGEGAGSVQATHVVNANGKKVGLLGISIPEYPRGKVGFAVDDATAAAKKSLASLKKQGVDIIVGLFAAQRGEALRLVERVPQMQLAVIGKGYDQGEANDPPFAPEVIGQTLVTQAPNHLQGISVVDLFVRDSDHSFVDASGLESVQRRQSLERRIEELEKRLVVWRQDGEVKKDDLKSREDELATLKKQLASIPRAKRPEQGSYFLYDLMEVREAQGTDGRVASRLMAYYRKVNQHNKVAFADKKPRPAPEGESSYVGVDACSNCHVEERAFWDKSPHAGAYETLSSQHKEFNLDCVSCHVTGYEKAGGSTVTHVENLTDVQCEVCHGPGSRHVENPADESLIQLTPSRSLCASSCHHPPHVGSDWTVEEAWPKILGPGHRVEKK